MPTYIDPLTRTRIDWPARQAGVVTVAGEVGDPLPLKMPITVTFRRRDLIDLLHVKDRVRLICEDQAYLQAHGEEAPPAALIDEQALSGIFLNVADSIAYDLLLRVIWYDVEARSISPFTIIEERGRWVVRYDVEARDIPVRRLQRADRDYQSWAPKPSARWPSVGELPLLRVTYPQRLLHGKNRRTLMEWCTTSGRRGHVALLKALFHTLFPPCLLLCLLYPPKGKAAKAWPLTQHVPLALFMAAKIVTAAHADQSLVTRITRTLKREPEVWEYVDTYAGVSRDPLPVKASAVALVDRAFRSAWGEYNVKQPLLEDPKDVFHHYLSSQTRQRIVYQWQGYTPNEQHQQLIWWTRLLLGSPGQAARVFSLLR